jgi:polysaccharide export outer membrane protein
MIFDFLLPIRRHSVRFFLLSGTVFLNACATLPESGPSTSAVISDGAQGAGQTGVPGYQFVDLTEQNAAAFDRGDGDSAQVEAAAFSALPPATSLGRIGAGDLLQITLWESDPTGATLLTPPGLNVSLRVDPSGLIELPYVGALPVAGRTPLAVQRNIMSTLQAQGHDIQAAVLDTDDVSNAAIVEGDANRPGTYPLSIGARNLLDLIAIAGGSKLADDATVVEVRRGDAEARAPLTSIVSNPELDIPLTPGDSVMLAARNRAFYAFGAVNRPGLFPYNAPKITLTQVLAEIAGLQDNLAAPRGVFIFRHAPGPQTVYHLDLSKPESFFTADQFVVCPDDIIYVSDAPIANVSKVLQTISGAGGVAGIPRNFGAPY